MSIRKLPRVSGVPAPATESPPKPRRFTNTDRTDGGVGGKPTEYPVLISVPHGGNAAQLEESDANHLELKAVIHWPNGLSEWAQDQLTRRLDKIPIWRDKTGNPVNPPVPWPRA